MIAGACQADVGVLVISARKGEFEAGFDKGGQTREHAMLAKTLGVRILVIVINKMDDPSCGWAKERFDECVTKLTPFLKQCGYNVKKDVVFLPISVRARNSAQFWRATCAGGLRNSSDAASPPSRAPQALTAQNVIKPVGDVAVVGGRHLHDDARRAPRARAQQDGAAPAADPLEVKDI